MIFLPVTTTIPIRKPFVRCPSFVAAVRTALTSSPSP